MSDPQKYRTREEIDEYRKRDAIQSFVTKLTGEKILSEEEWKDMIQRISAQIEEAVAFAEESPEPALSELYTDIYA
jgi:pyruvate dehydrogenase E1 component alpha subunit